MTKNPARVREAQLPVKHPAKFTNVIMDQIERVVLAECERFDPDEPVYLFDPMGGIGGVFGLHTAIDGLMITCIEIEKEWADSAAGNPLKYICDHAIHDDFLKWSAGEEDMDWDIAVTSPTYGNRMADKHQPSPSDTSKRNTYKHTLGRDLTEGSSAGMQWGDTYRSFHAEAWQQVYRLLKPGGMFVLNVKDHIRKGTKQPVVAWHRTLCKNLGFKLIEDIEIPVKGLRQGENHEVRVDVEHVMVFRRPEMDVSRVSKKWTQPRLSREMK